MERFAVVCGLALAACGPVVELGPGADDDPGASDDTTTTSSTTPSSATTLDTSITVSSSTTVEPTTDAPPPPPEAGSCTPLCELPIDCCIGELTCESMLGTYPYDYGCDNGTCTFGGCTSDEDCTFGGAIEGFICVEVDGYPGCWPSCVTDQDCDAYFSGGWVCTGGGGVYCEQPPCVSDEDCPDDLRCDPDSGVCFYACTVNDFCGDNGHCDPLTGACVCSSDDECIEGFGCRPPP
jgi:hypothetical protein